MKKIILALACAFSVIVTKASDSKWFSGSADGAQLSAEKATWSQPVSGVEVAEGVITLDLDTDERMTLTPDANTAPDAETKTSVNVTANFYPNALEDLERPTDAQTALAVAYVSDESALGYYAWNGSDWVALSGATPVAEGATEVKVQIELDYYRSGETKARFTIGTAILTCQNDEWLTLKTTSRAVSSVAFAGSGKLKSVESTVELGVASVDGVKYPTLAEAVAALSAATTKTVTLLRDSDEAVTLLTAGSAFDTNGKNYTGTFAVDSSLGWTEVNGVYAADDNTASTWTGSANDNAWTTAGNWSNHAVPTASTAVTIPAGDWVIYVGGDANAKSLAVIGNTTIQRDASISNYGNIVVQTAITTGQTPATLTLNSANIFAGSADAVTITCPLAFKNDVAAYTSGLKSNALGSFVVNGAVSSAGGTLSVARPVTFNGTVTLTGKSTISTYAVIYNNAVTLGDDATISIGSATQTYGENFVLNGSGTVIGNTQLPGTTMRTKLQGETWTGVCELKDITDTGWGINIDNFGNDQSIVRLNNVTVGAIGTGNGTYTTNLELVGDGLILNGDYSRASTFSGKLSGSGALTVTRVGTSGSTITFTGDVSGFTGSIALTSSNTAAVLFGASTGSGERIVVGSGKTVKIGGDSTWNAANVIVLGELIVDGTLTVEDNKIWGSDGKGVIRFTDSSKALTMDKFASNWNGTYVVGWDPKLDSAELKLYDYGNANSTVALSGVSAGYVGINGNTNIASTVRLDGAVKFTNGWPTTVPEEGSLPTTRLTTLAKVSGTADWTLGYTGSSTSWSSSSKCHLLVSALDGAYSGEISIGKHWLLEIDAVDYATAAPTTRGSALIALTVAEDGTLYNSAHKAVTAANGAAIDVTVAGEPADAKLVLGADGLYLAVAKIGTTYYKSYADAVAAYTTGDIEVLDGGAGAVPAGWKINGGFLVLSEVEVKLDETPTAEAPVTVSVAVPRACTANGLIDTENRAAGDILKVWSKTDKCYYTWELTSKKAWEPKETYKVTETDVTSHSKLASEVNLTAGQAVWITITTSESVKLKVAYNAAPVAVSVDAGWNLVAPTTPGDTTVNAIIESTGAADNDSIVVPTKTVPKVYTKVNGEWGYTTIEEVKTQNGLTIGRSVHKAEDTTIKAGTGVWFVNGSGNSKDINL